MGDVCGMNIFVLSTTLLLIYMTTVFVFALWLKDNSIVDVAYGAAFVLVGWTGLLILGNGHARQWLVVLLVTLWGVRLAVHILLRKQGEGEDFRYRQWRESWGNTFVWRSFLQIFMLQGAVIFLVVLPVQLVINAPGGQLGMLDRIGVLIWLFGFAFETIGDWQLLQFKKNPLNQGGIIQHGLWRYTRHPNYFGEAVLWWGIFLIALNAEYGLWALISPVLINFLLLKVSGIPMLELKYQSNPEFIAYKSRTNAFFPWLPKKGGVNE
jgi:steroid 5-alpha reductase family enzyme